MSMERAEKGLESFANRIFRSRKWFYVETILLIGLFALFAESICDYDNKLFQTLKYQNADRFILAILLIVFIVRKVRLINWQSLLVTLIFVPIALWQINLWNESPDIRNILLYETPCEWIALMILLDMFLYKKKLNNLGKANVTMLALYTLLAVSMLFHRNGRNEPLYLIFPLAFFIITDIEKEEWNRLIKCMVGGWFIYYVYALVKSFVENPYRGGRYYGYYVNIGSFGMFLCCSFVFALITIFYARQKKGVKSGLFVLGILWLFSVLFMFWLTNTRTLLAGVLGVLLFFFLFVRKDHSLKAIIKRLLLILGVVLLMVGVYVVLFYTIPNHKSWWFDNKAEKAGLLAPLYVIGSRVASLREKIDTSSIGRLLFTSIDSFSSLRLSIIVAYAQYFNFSGNSIPYIYIPVGDYYAVSAHNNYVQFIADYGYATAALYFTLIISSLVLAVKKYYSGGKRLTEMLVCMWIFMCLGMWMGEACTLNFPAAFIMMLFICRIISEKREAEGET